ncbi:MAG: hypothetical protein WAU86_06295 [Oricola sp.]
MLSGKSILIVEDAALIAVDIETVLNELGATHVSTEGGGESSASAPRRFDLAVIDIRSAVALENDLVGELDNGGVPAIFLTTDSEGNGIPRFSGRFEIVQKPFTYEDLCAAIARLID